MEDNRRLDAVVAEDYLLVLLKEIAAKRGRIFVAEREGVAVGWAGVTREAHPLFVVEEGRAFGYITELFVVEAARGGGVGRALMAACEAEVRGWGLGQIVVGVLSANRRTADIYARAGFHPYTTELRKFL